MDRTRQSRDGENANEFSARPSECGRFCVITIVVGGSRASVKLDQRETGNLAVTLNCMAAGLKDLASDG